MLRAVDGLIVGGVIAGVIWYARREQRKAEVRAATAERVAQLAAATAHGDRALAHGNATAAALTAAARPSPPPRPLSASPPPPAPRSTKPSQPGKPAGLTRRFDELFARHGRGIPVTYLRALANAESGMRPDDRLGLINVVPTTLADYNSRNKDAPIKPEQMRDPASNIRVAAETLRTIIESYQHHHPDVPNMVENWSNRRFVELLTLAWVTSHSELAGVGRVVGYLKTPPTTVRAADITIDRVFDAALQANAAPALSNRRKLDYVRSIVASFVRETERDARTRPHPTR